MYILLRKKYRFEILFVVFNERKIETYNECLSMRVDETLIKEYEIGSDGVSYHYNKFYVTAIPLKRKKEGVLYAFFRLMGFPCLDNRDILGFGEQPRVFILTTGEFKNDVFNM